MCNKYSACSVIAGLLHITVGVFLFLASSCLKLLSWVCSLSENGSFGRPEAVLGDKGTFGRPEAVLGDNGAFGRPEAVLGDKGTFGRPEAVLGDNGKDYQETGRMVTLDKYHTKIFQNALEGRPLDLELPNLAGYLCLLDNRRSP
ncbi:hypothetical protein AVEN_23245-1 [Araneus ventricosus]|uniref:Uncharacterized protein n=1 Tax=Araneus ventricosus TaxID=182803 RepID=A0A4Y2RVA6_ARAVE|nr:hypothetical protein AVEN_23245-1 [Araneus ventricosus]